MTGPGRRRWSPLERYLPLSYFGAVLLSVALLLPTTLRPPPEDPTTSAEFSPDAPPDDAQDSILSSLSRGMTSTAGAAEDRSDGPALGADEARREPPARGCPFGFGDPPRQVESLYAAPCAPAFVGGNGGDTSRGVTADEVRVALVQPRGGEQSGEEGAVPTEPSANESAQTRTFRVLQHYFNERYQFYGRTMRLYEMKSGQGGTNQRAAAVKAHEEYEAFGALTWNIAGAEELGRRGVVTFAGLDYDADFLEQYELYSWWTDAVLKSHIAGEYICDRLHGRPAEFAGDPLIAERERRLGLIYFDAERPGVPRTLDEHLDACGARFVERVGYNLETNQSTIATAITRMNAENVTTIVFAGEWVGGAALTESADSQAYFPEWFFLGVGLIDVNENGRRQARGQWRNAFGLSALEMPRRVENTDCWRAYKSIDPSRSPHMQICEVVWPSLVQMANGIQMAGPTLTPESFHTGLMRMGKRPPSPVWSVGGGFGPGDRSYGDYFSEVWWDPTATDPVDGRSPGAYRYVDGGRRFTRGEVPSNDAGLFREGVTEAPE